MSITSAFVLFSVIWFMTFFVILPIRIVTQGDNNDVVPGTHKGAPETHHLKRKAWITTGVSVVLFAIIASIIISGLITVRDLDVFHQLPPLQ
ncbi:DUF1467 family protein [Chachezhania antarctica]|uniref:DUF1467 family protein n=1 Tax=Chachezhania antarctica TaxID=2340860 RepID=UPI000EAE5194|nr:DUF1467 family protein [Chachezhania antarctica]|tara:strand:- start:880 stop:1155 length:276 start_codon:yes stop_codon:yes gene_type:complete